MKTIGITGQTGFIGTHLYNTLSLYPNKFERIPFADEYFQNEKTLDAFVKQCDVIVHLAAMNRHNDPDVLYCTNIELVQKLINAMERTDSKPYVIMSSSLQEERDNLYGRSKREGRELFNQWAELNDARFTGLIIPNVFGPFGVPFYNSVISTFSYQVANGFEPKIEIDAKLKLIYVGELVDLMLDLVNGYTDLTDGTDGHGLGSLTTENIKGHQDVPRLISIEPMVEHRVTELLEMLRGYRDLYQIKGMFPGLRDRFELYLFNTFRSYIPKEHFPVRFQRHEDERGMFVETMKALSGGQTSFSTTVPGITRGNHFHLRKVERFAVISGKASIKLRKYGKNEVIEYLLDGSEPAYVDMPIWYTHNITNIGDTELLTMFWINEFFDPTDPDTYYEQV